MQSAILLWQIRPSVCLTVTLWYCIKTNTHIVKLFLLSKTATDMLIIKQNMMGLIATMNKTYIKYKSDKLLQLCFT